MDSVVAVFYNSALMSVSSLQPRTSPIPQTICLISSAMADLQKTRTFWKMHQAIECLANFERKDFHENRMHIFSEETSNTGVRNFQVMSYKEFAHVASSPTRAPHWYEIILEDEPCWLYFDIEGDLTCNDHLADPKSVMAVFFEILTNYSKEKFGVVLDISKWVDLEFCFENNKQCLIFVQNFLAVASEQTTLPYSMLRVKKKKNGEEFTETSLVDTSVYTRNRCFRVLFSSKCGKDATLESALGIDVGLPRCEQILQSLVTAVPYSAQKRAIGSLPSAKLPSGRGLFLK